MPKHAFDDADELEAPDVTDAELAATFANLVRADVSGAVPGAVKGAIDEKAEDHGRMLLALADALQDPSLAQWLAASPGRKQRAAAIARAVAPPDPGAAHNVSTTAAFRAFRAWDDFPYRLLVVPGYTPLDEKEAKPGVHPVARRRLEMALEDHRAGKAPFFLLSGANVYPRGTRYFEAIEMKGALCAMGVAPDRIFLDARARHTTTNLRNAGRLMRALGFDRALVITKGGGLGGSDLFGQDFYLANPTLSTFHARCERELGHRVGELRGAGDGRIELVASAAVDQPGCDPLDP